jgi:hypothetical protein
MILVTYPPAARGRSLLAPKAIGRLSAAVAEARAAEPQPRRPTTPLAPAAGARRVRPMAPPDAGDDRVVVRLWLPLTLLFILLAPFAMLLSPLLWLAPEPYRINPIRTVFSLGAVLLSLGGTVVDVDVADARVLIRIF